MNRIILALLLLGVSALHPVPVLADEAGIETTEPEVAQADEALVEVEDDPSLLSEEEPQPESVAEAAPESEAPEEITVVSPPPVSITLRIETDDEMLFNESLAVEPCLPSPAAETKTVSGYCALEQSGVSTAWTWYGSDAFIDTIGGATNDHARSVYWNWFSDYSYGMTSLNAHQLSNDEVLLITLGPFPLQLSIPESGFRVGSTTSITVLEFGFDSSYNPTWKPAEESVVLINGASYTTDSLGVLAYTPTTEDDLEILASKDGFIETQAETVQVDAARNEPSPGGTNTEEPVEPNEKLDPTQAAVAFLLSHQKPDGSFPNALITDWAALALKGARVSTKTLKQYLVSSAETPSSVTDFERRAMALEALGVNPTEEVQEVLGEFDGSQIGDRSLINDDIFALIALSHAGYNTSDKIVQKIIAFLLENQDPNGSFENIDLTAAAIQALAPFSSEPGVTGSLDMAQSFLKAHQQADGCFGNSFATSWSIMAIHALGETPSVWRTNAGTSPTECLSSLQSADGGFETGASTYTRVWATAYAIPALTGHTWHTLLGTFKKKSYVEAAEPLVRELPVQEAPLAAAPFTPETLDTPGMVTVEKPVEVAQTHDVVVAKEKAQNSTLAASAILSYPAESEPDTATGSIVDFFISSIQALYKFGLELLALLSDV